MNNRQFFLLVGGLLILLSVGIALIWAVSGSLDALDRPVPVLLQQAEWSGASSGVTLAEAEQQARPQALSWASDARLIKVTASWRPKVDDLQLETPPITWALIYYSPSKEAMATAHVDADSFAWGKSRPLGVDAEALTPFPPAQKIRVAWLSFRAAGGEAFLAEHPGATVQFSLRNVDGLVWTVLAFTRTAKFEVDVDADTGTVVSRDS